MNNKKLRKHEEDILKIDRQINFIINFINKNFYKLNVKNIIEDFEIESDDESETELVYSDYEFDE